MRCIVCLASALMAVSGCTTAEATQPEPIYKSNPAGVAKPIAAYSHVAIVPAGTKLLYLAGQVGNRPDGTVPPRMEDQIIQAFENVRTILASQGAGPEHITKLVIYAAARPTDLAKLREHRQAFYRGTMPPPSTWVYVNALARPEYLVEVDATAAVPSR